MVYSAQMANVDASPGGKRARTRAALVEAALEVIAKKGMMAASLDEIAARAHMSKGAVYSNYSSKAHLMMAVMAARGVRFPLFELADAPLREQLIQFGKDLAATIRRARSEARLVAEFQLFALTDA